MDDASPESIDPVEPGQLGATAYVERLAENEATARRINESIEAGRVSRDGLTGFVCECGLLGCNAIVELTLREYEEVRSDPRRFFVAVGHEPSIDTAVAREDRYAIVAKHGIAGRIAETTDPRAEGR